MNYKSIYFHVIKMNDYFLCDKKTAVAKPLL